MLTVYTSEQEELVPYVNIARRYSPGHSEINLLSNFERVRGELGCKSNEARSAFHTYSMSRNQLHQLSIETSRIREYYIRSCPFSDCRRGQKITLGSNERATFTRLE